ncbi:unnamed protein product [Lupinus luteus]|uniref:Uncharacterized protein n=1 Tax=Lupinus luteus TaxID=3873 RepID=A0AAV1XKS6_LUPLU
MAAKRIFDDSDQGPDKPSDKRLRPTRPSFASVIGEVLKMKNMQNFLSDLEPFLKRVVSEEVERVMRQCCPPPPPPPPMTMSHSSRIQSLEEQSTNLRLTFSKTLSLPIFTGSKILDPNGDHINIILVDKSNGQITSLSHPIKLEIVVLDGDFPSDDNEANWTSNQFNNHIVKERNGKRPLLAGELNLSMRDGIAPIGDLEFTDNSSWIRSRKFRVAVRVAAGVNQGVRIREGMTEAFVVKDHRGELYKKHHPPMLHDEVWRLEKIRKDGAFHRKLCSGGIKTVQDFLKLSVIDHHKLRKILGIGMSEKMWDITMRHARTCDMGSKIYIHNGSHFTIFLNPICQLIRADINGQTFAARELSNINRQSYIEKLVREAYASWHSLKMIDRVFNNNIDLFTQGNQTVEQIPNNHATTVVTHDQNDYYGH